MAEDFAVIVNTNESAIEVSDVELMLARKTSNHARVFLMMHRLFRPICVVDCSDPDPRRTIIRWKPRSNSLEEEYSDKEGGPEPIASDRHCLPSSTIVNGYPSVFDLHLLQYCGCIPLQRCAITALVSSNLGNEREVGNRARLADSDNN